MTQQLDARIRPSLAQQAQRRERDDKVAQRAAPDDENFGHDLWPARRGRCHFRPLSKVAKAVPAIASGPASFFVRIRRRRTDNLE
jgi:hypothetical protein